MIETRPIIRLATLIIIMRKGKPKLSLNLRVNPKVFPALDPHLHLGS